MRGIIVASAVILLGAIIFCVAMTMLGWDFTRLSTQKMETNEYDINEKFTNIEVNIDTADIIFLPSDNDKCRVVCYEKMNFKHTVKVENDSLVINSTDEGRWIDHIGFNFSAPKITVYMPEGEYGALKIESSTSDISLPKDFKLNNIDISLTTGDVECYASATNAIKIKTSTGNIGIRDTSSASLDLTVSTGKVRASRIECAGDLSLTVTTGESYLSDIKCKNLTTEGNTGDISLTEVIVTEKLSIKRTTGDVEFDDLDAGEISINTSTGDVEGTLLSEKIFITKTSTGEIDVPRTTSGGICEITTSTGDIEVDIK